jgi:hypothetical protein
MGFTVFDPTDGPAGGEFRRAPALASLAGKRVGLLDNGKPRSDVLLRYLGDLLTAEASAAEVVMVRKASAYRPAPEAQLDDLAGRVEAVVAGIGD